MEDSMLDDPRQLEPFPTPVIRPTIRTYLVDMVAADLLGIPVNTLRKHREERTEYQQIMWCANDIIEACLPQHFLDGASHVH